MTNPCYIIVLVINSQPSLFSYLAASQSVLNLLAFHDIIVYKLRIHEVLYQCDLSLVIRATCKLAKQNSLIIGYKILPAHIGAENSYI